MRDPIWQFFGVIISIVAIIISIFQQSWSIFALAAVLIITIAIYLNWSKVAPSLIPYTSKVQKLYSSLKNITGEIVPFLSFACLFIFLSPEAIMYAYFVNIMTVVLLLLAFLSSKTIAPPMNKVVSILNFYGIATVLVVAYSKEIIPVVLPPTFSNPNLSDPRTVIILASLGLVACIYTIASVLTRYISEQISLTDESLSFIYQSPDIKEFVSKREKQLITEIRTKWKGFQSNLASSRPRLAETLKHSVPVKCERFTIIIGFLTQNEVDEIMKFAAQAIVPFPRLKIL